MTAKWYAALALLPAVALLVWIATLVMPSLSTGSQGSGPPSAIAQGGAAVPPAYPTLSSDTNDESDPSVLFPAVEGDPPPSIGVEAPRSSSVGTDFGQLAHVTESPTGPTDSIARTTQAQTPDASYPTRTDGQGESSLPPLGEPLRGPLSEPDRSPPRHPQEGDPTDPGTPDDAPEPSTLRTPTLDVNDDDEPKTTGLFSELKGVPPTGTGVDVLDSRLVEIDFAQLADAIESRRDPASGLPTLVLNLFDDVVFTGVVEHVEPTSSGHSLWGSLEGVDLGTMTLVVNGSVVAGTVRTPDAVFTVKTTGQGEYVVRQIDESSLPPLGEPLRGPLSEPDRSPPRHPQEGDPMDPGTPDDTPEPSTPRKPTSEVDDNEPKSTGLFSELKGVPASASSRRSCAGCAE